MNEITFKTENFGILELIEKFNKEHWIGNPTDLGWR